MQSLCLAYNNCLHYMLVIFSSLNSVVVGFEGGIVLLKITLDEEDWHKAFNPLKILIKNTFIYKINMDKIKDFVFWWWVHYAFLLITEKKHLEMCWFKNISFVNEKWHIWKNYSLIVTLQFLKFKKWELGYIVSKF